MGINAIEQAAVSTAHAVTRIVELTGIAIIAFGAFATLILFLYRLLSGVDRDQAVANFRSSLAARSFWAWNSWSPQTSSTPLRSNRRC